MWQANPYQPVNPNASKEVHQLLNYLNSIRGKHVLSGQHNYSGNSCSEKTAAITKHYPAIWGADFLNYQNKQLLVDEAIRQHQNGSIITLMYHQVKPFDPDSLGFAKSVQGRVTDEEWEAIITPNTKYNLMWLEKIDVVAVALKQLQQLKIPILWRPFHEMNGVWFWWGDRPITPNSSQDKSFRVLWKMIYERYTNYHQLNNLIWVWNANAPRLTVGDEAYSYEKYYPGHEYVDILAADVYHNDYRQSHHDQLLTLAEGKLIALGEIGEVPSPEIFEQQNQWVWFMVWAEYNLTHNTPQQLNDLFNYHCVLNLKDLPKTYDDFLLTNTLSIAKGDELSEAEKAYQTPTESLKKLLEDYPEGKFIYVQADGEEIVQTYQETWQKAKKILGSLQAQGIESGSFVIFQLENALDFTTCFWSCIMGGFVPIPTPIITKYTQSNQKVNQLSQTFQLLDNSFILTTQKFTQEIASTLNLKDTNRIVAMDCLEKENIEGNLYYHQPEELGFFLLSSGTTGKPKIITFDARTLAYRLLGDSKNEWMSKEIFLSWLPLEHIGGLRSAIPNAPTKVFLNTNAFLQNPLVWLDAIAKHRVTAANMINFALSLMSESIQKSSSKKWDLSSIKSIGIGAETISPQTLSNFLAQLTPFGLNPEVLTTGYGMSECGTITSHGKFSIKTTPEGGTFVEVGTPSVGHSVRIVDEDDQLVPEKEIGYIQAIGPTMTSGYYKNPELNQNLFTTDGWINTGDLGFLESDRLIVTGRKKDIIIINGYKYPSSVIETIVEEISDISKGYTIACAVRPENNSSDELAIFFHTSFSETKELIILFNQIRLKIAEKFGVNPMYIIPLEKAMIPRTNTGKIQRFELKKRFEQGFFSDIIESVQKIIKENLASNYVAPNTDTETKLAHIWSEILHVQLIGIDNNFFTLGGNSLLASQMVSRIRDVFGVEFPLRDMFKYSTIRKLAEYLDILLWVDSKPQIFDDNLEFGSF